jgi:epoxyqueuosine reductase
MPSIASITDLVKRAAHDAGFELAGIAPVRDFDELAYFPRWIEAGHAGEMKYLEARDEAGRLRRESLRVSAPWARSVIVCAINYNTAQPYSTHANDPQRGWISRYAWGREDYHDAVLRKLRDIEKQLTDALIARDENESRPDTNTDLSAMPAGLRTWCYVDTGPIVERVYAKYAGVGWIGKNTCVLNQKLGSWLFLGVILTRTLSLVPTNSMRTNASRTSPSKSAARSQNNYATALENMCSGATSARTCARGTARLLSPLQQNSSHARSS